MDMQKWFLWAALVLVPASWAHAQAPDAATIQLAMNESLELEFPFFQEFADVQILRGGVTAAGDYLFLCSGNLRWKLSSTDFEALLQQEIDQAVPEQETYEQQLLARALANSLATKLSQIGTFAAGDIVSEVRFRVRLEQAGADWLPTTTKVKESKRNPLNIIDNGES